MDQAHPRRRSVSTGPLPVARSPSPENPLEETEEPEEEPEVNSVGSENDISEPNDSDDLPDLRPRMHRQRRLSTYTTSDAGEDLESDIIGGSARRA